MDVLKKIPTVAFVALLTACSSTSKVESTEETIAFSAIETSTSYELTCKPLNSTVAKDASWVKKCNSVAYQFLMSKTKSGVSFAKEINQKPFGQAAAFVSNMLKRNPQNFEDVSIEQTYAFVKNKT